MQQRLFTSGSRQAPDPYDRFLESNNFYRKHTARDPSSLFRVISEQVFDTQLHHLYARKMIVRYMRQNRNVFDKLVEVNFDDYLFEMSNPKTAGTFIEVEAAASLFKRTIILFEPYNLGTVFKTQPHYNGLIRIFCTSEGHFDSVFSSDYIKDAAMCQAICYKILYKDVFKLPDVSFAVEHMLHSNSLNCCDYDVEMDTDGYCTSIQYKDGRSFALDLPQNTNCILDKRELCHFHTPNFSEATISSGPGTTVSKRDNDNDDESDEDNYSKPLIQSPDALPQKYISCVRQLLLEGISPFPYKVAKALEPTMYRNIEFDAWNEIRKEMKMLNWYTGGNNFKVGAKCQIKLDDSEPYFCHIQEIGKKRDLCLVYIEQSAEKRWVPYKELIPIPPEDFKPWALPYSMQRRLQRRLQRYQSMPVSRNLCYKSKNGLHNHNAKNKVNHNENYDYPNNSLYYQHNHQAISYYTGPDYYYCNQPQQHMAISDETIYVTPNGFTNVPHIMDNGFQYGCSGGGGDMLHPIKAEHCGYYYNNFANSNYIDGSCSYNYKHFLNVDNFQPTSMDYVALPVIVDHKSGVGNNSPRSGVDSTRYISPPPNGHSNNSGTRNSNSTNNGSKRHSTLPQGSKRKPATTTNSSSYRRSGMPNSKNNNHVHSNRMKNLNSTGKTISNISVASCSNNAPPSVVYSISDSAISNIVEMGRDISTASEREHYDVYGNTRGSPRPSSYNRTTLSSIPIPPIIMSDMQSNDIDEDDQNVPKASAMPMLPDVYTFYPDYNNPTSSIPGPSNTYFPPHINVGQPQGPQNYCVLQPNQNFQYQLAPQQANLYSAQSHTVLSQPYSHPLELHGRPAGIPIENIYDNGRSLINSKTTTHCQNTKYEVFPTKILRGRGGEFSKNASVRSIPPMPPKKSVDPEGKDLPNNKKELQYYYNMGVDTYLDKEFKLESKTRLDSTENKTALQDYENISSLEVEIKTEKSENPTRMSSPARGSEYSKRSLIKESNEESEEVEITSGSQIMTVTIVKKKDPENSNEILHEEGENTVVSKRSAINANNDNMRKVDFDCPHINIFCSPPPNPPTNCFSQPVQPPRAISIYSQTEEPPRPTSIYSQMEQPPRPTSSSSQRALPLAPSGRSRSSEPTQSRSYYSQQIQPPPPTYSQQGHSLSSYLQPTLPPPSFYSQLEEPTSCYLQQAQPPPIYYAQPHEQLSPTSCPQRAQQPHTSCPQPAQQPHTSCYSQSGAPPSTTPFYSQPGQSPQPTACYVQPAQPPPASSYSQTCQPAQSTPCYSQSGQSPPPTSCTSQPAQSSPTSCNSQPGQSPPPSCTLQPAQSSPTSCYSQPGQSPQPTACYAQPVQTSPTPCYSQSEQSSQPKSCYSQPAQSAPTSCYSQSGQPPPSTPCYSQPREAPTSTQCYSQTAQSSPSSCYLQSGQPPPPTSCYSQQSPPAPQTPQKNPSQVSLKTPAVITKACGDPVSQSANTRAPNANINPLYAFHPPGTDYCGDPFALCPPAVGAGAYYLPSCYYYSPAPCMPPNGVLYQMPIGSDLPENCDGDMGTPWLMNCPATQMPCYYSTNQYGPPNSTAGTYQDQAIASVPGGNPSYMSMTIPNNRLQRDYVEISEGQPEYWCAVVQPSFPTCPPGCPPTCQPPIITVCQPRDPQNSDKKYDNVNDDSQSIAEYISLTNATNAFKRSNTNLSSATRNTVKSPSPARSGKNSNQVSEKQSRAGSRQPSRVGSRSSRIGLSKSPSRK